MSAQLAVSGRALKPSTGLANQQRSSDRLLAQIQQKLLQGHRLIVDADYEVTQLGEEEFDVFVGELAEFAAQHIVDADVVGIASAAGGRVSRRCSSGESAGHGTHERYDTERKGFWLKTSLSRNRFSRSQDIGIGCDGGRGRDQTAPSWTSSSGIKSCNSHRRAQELQHDCRSASVRWAGGRCRAWTSRLRFIISGLRIDAR